MSLNIKTPTGLQRIAGSTIILDATASEIREGTFSIQCLGNSGANITVTFETPMPDTDYVVVFEPNSPAPGEIGFRNKTTTGFNLFTLGGRGDDTTEYTFTGKYYAFRLVKLEGYTELQNKVNNPDSAPTENSTNLVTSGGVYEAIQNATKVFIGTEAEWEAETEKTKYQLAVLTDKTQIDAVDETTGDTETVADKTKRFTGLRSEWEALTAAEKAEYEIVCLLDDTEDASTIVFATISSENAAVTAGDYICSKNGKNVCVMLKGKANGIITAATKIFSGFFSPLTPDNYSYLDVPFAIRNRTTNVTEMRMGYLNATGDFYTSTYTENIESNWDIQLFFNYQTEN